MHTGFWAGLTRPIVGLAPMDGVTDAAFRYITAKYGKPSLVITEFTSAEGIRAGALRLLDDFLYSEEERPVVAQLFGADPEAFYISAIVACALGFDGIDINMGCPAKNVTSHGAGAALILDPLRARTIIQKTKEGIADWVQGIQLEDLNLPEALITEIRLRQPAEISRQILPVSVKTRLGYHQSIIEQWVGELLEEELAAISIHGRTLKQLYSGQADWDEIARAAQIIKQTPTLVLGNGDVSSYQDGLSKMETYGVDGVLIGRAAFGNPWIFQDQEAAWPEKAAVALEHARYFAEHFPPQAFVRMRKHLLDYTKGFEGAKEARIALMRASDLAEVERVLQPHLS